MGPGTPLSRGRFAFSLLMAVLLVFTSVPFSFAQDATPDAPVVTEEPVEAPVVEPVEEPANEVVTEEPVTDPVVERAAEEASEVPQEPVDEPVAAPVTTDVVEPAAEPVSDVTQAEATKQIGLGSTEPVRCEPGYWMFVLKPKPVAPIAPLTVTFANGNVETLKAVTSSSGQASFRTATNRDSTVVSAVAVVPESFQPTSFVIQAGPCNDEPEPGKYDVTINAVTSDAGSATGAPVTVTDIDGTVTREGVIGENNTFLAEELPDGAYTVVIDGWSAQYNRVSKDFSVTNADRSVDVELTRLKAGSIEIEAGESNQAGGARIQGALVTIENMEGSEVARGTTDERGKFRSDVLPPSIYSVTVDGSEVGYTTVTHTVSNERGGHLFGVVLERLPEPVLETISATLITQCQASSTMWGAQMRHVNPYPDYVTFHFTDGTSADAEKFASLGSTASYRLPGHTGKTVASITAEIDTVANPNWWFQQTVGPCPGEYDVTGTVTDANTGMPIAGVTVEIQGTGLTAVTGEDGTYSVPRVPRGQHDFVFSAEGYEPATVNAYVNQATTRIVDAALEPISPTITVTVVDWDGSVPTDSWIEFDGERYELDANGQVVFENLPDGRYTFTVKWDDPVRKDRKTATLAGADVEVRFQLAAPLPSYSWALECPVITTSSQVGDVVDIGFTLTNTSREATVTNVEFSSRSGTTFTQSGTVLEPGASINGVASIPLLQSDLDDGYVNARINMEGRRVGANRTLSNTRTIECVISEAVNGTVTVVDADGTTPVEGATVTLNGTEFSGVTGADGTVVFEGLDDGTYTVSVVTADGRTASGTLFVEGADAAVTIVLSPILETVTVVVTDEKGRAVAGSSFVLTDGAGAVLHQGTLDASGQAIVEADLLAGEEYTVTAFAEGYRTASATQVASGADLAFDLVLERINNTKKVVVIAVDTDAAGGQATLVAPEGSTWTLTELKSGRVYRGEFSGAVPQTIDLPGAVGSGTFRIEVDAGQGFETYTGEVTIRGNRGLLYFELVPTVGDE